MKRNKSLLYRLVLMIAAAGLLAACGGPEHGDLKKFVNDLQKQEMPPIPPVTTINIPVSYDYKPVRDPFKQYRKAVVVDDSKKKECEKKKQHAREDLEDFALDALRMVGTMRKAGKLWGIVQDPSGAVHNVKVGNYLGQNNGKILAITEGEIKLLEVINDGTGACGWNEREAALALN